MHDYCPSGHLTKMCIVFLEPISMKNLVFSKINIDMLMHVYAVNSFCIIDLCMVGIIYIKYIKESL